MPLHRDYPFTVALNVGVDLVPWSMRRGWRRLYDVKLHDRGYVLMFLNVMTPRTVTGVGFVCGSGGNEKCGHPATGSVMITCQRSDSIEEAQNIQSFTMVIIHLRAVYKVSCKWVVMKEKSRYRNVCM